MRRLLSGVTGPVALLAGAPVLAEGSKSVNMVVKVLVDAPPPVQCKVLR